MLTQISSPGNIALVLNLIGNYLPVRSFIFFMLKRLLFFSCATLLAYRSSAQSIVNLKVRLPAELLSRKPGVARAPLLAARLATVSQLQEVLAQNWSGAWVDNSR